MGALLEIRTGTSVRRECAVSHTPFADSQRQHNVSPMVTSLWGERSHARPDGRSSPPRLPRSGMKEGAEERLGEDEQAKACAVADDWEEHQKRLEVRRTFEARARLVRLIVSDSMQQERQARCRTAPDDVS